jgi:hypothetical protein
MIAPADAFLPTLAPNDCVVGPELSVTNSSQLLGGVEHPTITPLMASGIVQPGVATATRKGSDQLEASVDRLGLTIVTKPPLLFFFG